MSKTKPTSPFYKSDRVIYADKEKLAENRNIIQIKEINYSEGTGYNKGDRWEVIADVFLNDGIVEEQVITLGCNEKRDEQMSEVLDYIAEHGRVEPVYLRIDNRVPYFCDARELKTRKNAQHKTEGIEENKKDALKAKLEKAKAKSKTVSADIDFEGEIPF